MEHANMVVAGYVNGMCDSNPAFTVPTNIAKPAEKNRPSGLEGVQEQLQSERFSERTAELLASKNRSGTQS